jgi:pimeloyl-ACP methyl ester carboxylesterase
MLGFMQENSQVAAIVAGWEEAVGDNTTLFFPVAWDWRRDFYEQSERVYNMVLHAKEQTGCNPILIGISFGGLVSYTAFTRYGAEFADHVHGVLYAVTPLQPMAIGATSALVGLDQVPFSSVFPRFFGLFSFYGGLILSKDLFAVFTTGFPGDTSADPVFDGETFFSYPSMWALVNPLNASCVNVPEMDDGEVQQCMAGEIDSGISCESAGAACGRPKDFRDAQFYLPIDLQVH